jgi:hypothetical protein
MVCENRFWATNAALLNGRGAIFDYIKLLSRERDGREIRKSLPYEAIPIGVALSRQSDPVVSESKTAR